MSRGKVSNVFIASRWIVESSTILQSWCKYLKLVLPSASNHLPCHFEILRFHHKVSTRHSGVARVETYSKMSLFPLLQVSITRRDGPIINGITDEASSKLRKSHVGILQLESQCRDTGHDVCVRIELLFVITMTLYESKTKSNPHHDVMSGYSIKRCCQSNDAYYFLTSLDGIRQFNAIL